MPLKTLLFSGLFALVVVAALFAPVWGVLGYAAHYVVGPERQWWYAPLSSLGLRCSLTLALATLVGMALHWGKLKYGPRFLGGHEKLLLLFLGVVWFSVFWGPETVGRYTQPGVDHPSVKFTKVFIFLLMLTHVITELRKMDKFLWVLILATLMVGLQAWSVPYRAFRSGRLDGVGGVDFTEANFFGTYMAAMLWIIGVQFLRSGWIGKAFCFLAGGFTANAAILTRSRGVVVALAAGAVAAVFAAPKRYRAYIAIGLVLAGIGFLYLTDEQFIHRATTIFAPEEERDVSAQSRVVLARAALRMWRDHPLGVGVGNFYQTIGNYLPEYAGKDAHNTYLRCLTETGIQGLVVFLALALSALVILRRVSRRAELELVSHKEDIKLLSFGMTCSLATILAGSLTISLTYVEYVWWFLMLPVCLQRTTENLIAEEQAAFESGPQGFDDESLQESADAP